MSPSNRFWSAVAAGFRAGRRRPDEEVLAAGLAWLYATPQPAGAILQHHGPTLAGAGHSYRFIPRGDRNRPVIVVEVADPQHRAALEPGGLAVLVEQLDAVGHRVVDAWNGHPAHTGSVALARPAHPTLLAAVDRYHAGCQLHLRESVFCQCGWFQDGYRLSRAAQPGWGPVVSGERCQLTDLLVGECGCRNHRGGRTVAEQALADRARLLLKPGWFPAAFPGRCTRCQEPFPEGAAICRDPGLGWRAECCP